VNLIWNLALVLSLFAFALAVFKDIGVSMIVNLDAILIVLGGTVIALFVGFPIERIRNTCRSIAKLYRTKQDRETVFQAIIGVSRMYRKTDIRKLEQTMSSVNSDFLRLGIKLLINDYRADEIKNIMEREMMHRLTESSHSQNLLRTIARLAPSLGLAGTVISLIKMFRHLDSIEAIAPMMAVALMSTFYGVIIANILMLPLAAKVREASIEAESLMNMTIEGILAVYAMEHPLKIEERLRGCSSQETAWSGHAVPARYVSSAT
jgi:chemotaxis protein MotA